MWGKRSLKPHPNECDSVKQVRKNTKTNVTLARNFCWKSTFTSHLNLLQNNLTILFISAKLLPTKMKPSTAPWKKFCSKLCLHYNVHIQLNSIWLHTWPRKTTKNVLDSVLLPIDSDDMVIDLHSTVYNYFKKPWFIITWLPLPVLDSQDNC